MIDQIQPFDRAVTMVLGCAVAFPQNSGCEAGRQAELSVWSAVTESALCVEFHFNKLAPLQLTCNFNCRFYSV